MAFLLALKLFGFVFSIELDREIDESGDPVEDDEKTADVIPARKFRLGFAAPEEHEDDEHEDEDTEEC